MYFTTKVRKIGNSAGIIIPKAICKALGLEAGDECDITMKSGKIILTKIKKPSL